MDDIWSSRKNVAYLSSVIASSPTEEFTVSAAMEAKLVKMLMAIPIIRGIFVDQSNRSGYGISMTWNGLKTDPEKWHRGYSNTAYLDASNEKDLLPVLMLCGNVSNWVISTHIIRLMNLVVSCVIMVAGLMVKEYTTFTPFMHLISLLM
nr:carbohydrate porin [Escherichia coli]